MKHHICKTGEVILIKDMSDSHLANTIRFLERKAEDGVVVGECGGFDGDGDPFYYSGSEIYGDDVKTRFNYKAYIYEYERRTGKKWGE